MHSLHSHAFFSPSPILFRPLQNSTFSLTLTHFVSFSQFPQLIQPFIAPEVYWPFYIGSYYLENEL